MLNEFTRCTLIENMRYDFLSGKAGLCLAVLKNICFQTCLDNEREARLVFYAMLCVLSVLGVLDVLSVLDVLRVLSALSVLDVPCVLGVLRVLCALSLNPVVLIRLAVNGVIKTCEKHKKCMQSCGQIAKL